MDKKLYVWGMEGREEGKINPETTKSQVIDLDATLQELATNIQSVEDELTSEIDAKIINVQSVGNVTVEGISVPSLSEGQVIAIHNAIVNKQMAIVNSVDGTGHFVVNQADSLNNEISVEFVYYATALVTYTVDNHSVVVSVKKFESGGGGGGGGGGKVYCRKINGSFTRPVGPVGETYYYISRSIITTDNTPWSISKIEQGFASETILGNGPVIIIRNQQMGPNSYSLANSISLYGNSCEIWRFNDDFFESFEDVTSIGQYTERISEL